jgi:membrane fusion protein, heavy metal efflux system
VANARLRVICSAIVCGSAAAGCTPAPAKPPAQAAAKKDVHSDEAQLATVKLSAEQETRLGLATAAVERIKAPKTRVYGGDAMIPPGRTMLIAAPLAGTLAAPRGTDGLKPGMTVKKGQVLLTLAPLLAPDAQVNYENQLVNLKGQVEEAKNQLVVAEGNFKRIQDLAKTRDASPGQLEDARLQLKGAQETLKKVETSRDAVEKTVRALSGGGLVEPLPIVAEVDGMLRNVSALPGQPVASGSPLFEIVSLDPLWIRVPVHVGDLREIEPDQAAVIGDLTGIAGDAGVSAPPVSAPPSADPLAHTVDLFYQLENKNASMRPGQRVGATLTLKGGGESVVIPKTAFFRDYFGGAWVYELTAPHTYVRRRVEIDRVVGPLAVLASGPQPGAKVVTTGAAEMAGTDFGFSK